MSSRREDADRSERTVLTVMCMIYDGSGNVIVQDRIDEGWSGLTFPGGHVEKGESFTDAVIREVFEETGITVSSPQLCGVKDWYDEEYGRYVVLLYKTCKYHGRLTSSDEGEVFWMKTSELQASARIAKGMDDMLRVFICGDISEYYCRRDNGHWKWVLK